MKKPKPSALAAYSERNQPLHLNAMAVAVAVAFSPALAQAQNLPTGLQTVKGAVTVSTPTPTSMQLNQTTQNAGMTAQTFSIGSGYRVDVLQPSRSSVMVMDVLGGNVSSIFGTLTATGNFFLVNPAGVVFAPGAMVDVGGLVATTMPISYADATSGRYVFTNKGNSGSVVNQGRITALNGYVGLFAPKVVNEGIIVARMGQVALAAGNQVTLDMVGDGLIKVAVSESALNASVMNKGTIEADGGNVLLTAKSANALLDTVINTDGIIRANTIANRNGTIVLDGGDKGVVSVSGTIEAKGSDAGTTGGTVKALGEYVGLFGNSHINVSGEAGGGSVLVGGNYQGQGPEANASSVFMSSGSIINADAGTNGDGGKVILWSDGLTSAHGTIWARGGVQSGNGGLIETSGHQFLDARGVRGGAGSINGKGGLWLFDPDSDVTITAAATTTPTDFDGGTPNTFAPTTDPVSNIQNTDINGILDGGTDVVITTSNAAGTQAGNIDVNAAISFTGGGAATRSLTLNAGTGGGAGSVNVNSTISGDATHLLNVTLDSATGGAGNGSVNLNAGGNINTFGGDFSVLAGAGGVTQDVTNTVDAGAGTILVDGGGGSINMAGQLTTTNATAAAATIQNASTVTLPGIQTGVGGTTTIGVGGDIAGLVQQTAGTILNTGTLAIDTSGDVTLTEANTVTNLGSVTTNGAFTYNNAGALNVTGAVTTQNNGLASITATGGGLTLTTGSVAGNGVSLITTGGGNHITLGNQLVDGNAGPVTLNAGSNIFQAATGVVNTAGLLSVSVDGSAGLGGANTVSSVTGTNTSGGVFGFNNTAATLTINGITSMTTGGIAVVNAGGITLAGDVGASGASVSLTANGGLLDLGVSNVTGPAFGGVTLAGSGVTQTGGTVNSGPDLLSINGNSNPVTLAGMLTTSNATAGAISITGATLLQVGNIDMTGGAGAKSTLTFSGAGSQAGGTTIQGANGALDINGGTMTLSQPNTYGGATTIIAGAVNVQNPTGLGLTTGGTTVNSGAALQVQGGITVTGEALTLNGAGVAADGALRNISGNNVWTGAVTLGSATRINSDADNLQISGGIGGAGQDLTIGGALDTTVTGVIATTTGSLTKDGAGLLTLTGANTYAGDTTIAGGILNIDSTGVAGTGTIVVGANQLSINSGAVVSNAVTINGGTISSAVGPGGTIQTGGISLLGTSNFNPFAGGSLTVSANITGAGGINQVGANMLTLSGTNTYAGATNVNLGTLTANGGSAIPDGSAVVMGGGVLNLGADEVVGSLAGTSNVTLNAFTLNAGGDGTSTAYSGAISGSGGLNKTGAGTLTLSGNSSYGGLTAVAGGTLEVSSDNALGGTGAGTIVASGATVQINGSGLSIAEPFNIEGTGDGGVGALRNLANTNTLSGTIALLGNATITNTSGTFNLTGNLIGASDITYDVVAGTLDESGIISGLGTNLIKNGAGTLRLSGASDNTYDGTTTINVGTLQAAKNGALGTGTGAPGDGTFVAGGATLDIDNAAIGTELVAIAGAGVGGAGALTGTNTASLAGPVVLTAAATIGGAGGLTLTGAAVTDGGSGFTLSVVGAGTQTFSTAVVDVGAIDVSKTGGAADFTSNVITATNFTTQNANFAVSLTGAANTIGGSATFLNDGNVTIGQGGGTSSFAGGLDTTGAAGTNTLNGTIATSNAAIALGDVSLGSTVILNTNATTAAGSIDIANVTGNTNALTLQTGTGADVNATGAIGGVTTLTLSSVGGTATLSGDVDVTNLSVDNSNVNVAFMGNGSSVTNAVDYQNTGTLTLGTLGGTQTYDGGLRTDNVVGTVTLNGTLATSGDVILMGDVTLASNTSLDTTAGGNPAGNSLTVGVVTGGGNDLTLNAGTGGTLTTGALNAIDVLTIGASTLNFGGGSFGSLDINVAGALTVSGATTTTGAMSFTGSGVTVNAGSTLQAGDDINVFATNTGGTGDVTISANIDQTAAATTTLDIRANNSIFFTNSADVSSNTDPLNVILNSNRDGIGAGAISLASGTVIDSLGGDISLVGGTTASGAALGSGANTEGIRLDNAQLLSDAGAITLIGQGIGTGVANAKGVQLDSGSIVQSSSGTITITGTGGGTGAGGTSAYGVGIDSSTVRTTTAGNIIIAGTNTNGAASDGQGVKLIAGTVQTDGAGTISITGTSAESAASAVFLNGSSLGSATASGDILLRATGGVTPDITLAGTTIQTTGNVTLNAGAGVTQAGGSILAAGLRLLGGGTFTLNSPTNNVATIAGAPASGTIVSYTDADALQVGSITSNDGTGSTTSNGLNVGAGTVSLTTTAAGGAITQTALGVITAGTLNLTTTDANATLNTAINAVTNLGAVSLGTGALNLLDAGGLALTGTVTANGGVTLDTSGTLALGSQNITGTGVSLTGIGVTSTGGTVNAGAGTILVDGNDGAISLAGALTTTNNTATAVRIIDSTTAALGNITTGGGGTVTVGEAAGDNITGAVIQTGVINAGTLIGNTGSTVVLGGLNQLANLDAFTSNGGFTLNNATGGGLNVTGAVSDAGGLVSITTTGGTLAVSPGSISGAGVSLTANAGGAISLGGVVNGNAGPVTLTSATSILQPSGSINTTGLLTTSSTTGTQLQQANTVNSFNGTNNGSGDIQFVNTPPSGTLVVTGISVTGGGEFDVSNTGAISITGPISTDGGDVTLAALGGAGAITESGGGLVSTTGTLDTDSTQGQTLNGANTVGTFTATNSTANAISLTNTAPTLTLTGILQSAAGGTVTVDQTGMLDVANAVSAPGLVDLKATGGDLTVFPGSGGVAGTGINLTTVTSGSINVLDTVNAGTGTATLVSADQMATFGVGLVSGLNADLTAVNGIGSAGNKVLTDVTNLKATNTFNGIEIINTGAGPLTLTSFGPGNAISNTNGGLILEVFNGNLNVNSPIVVGRKFALLADNGDIAVNASVSGTGSAPGVATSFLAASGAITQATGTTIETTGGSVANRRIDIGSNFFGGGASGVTQNGTAQINTNGGDLFVQDSGTGSITLTGASTAGTGAGNITVSAPGGAIAVNGIVTTGATGGTISLTSGGNIIETGSLITTGTLTGSAGGSVTLGGANEIGTLGSFTSSGGFALNDTTGGLTLGAAKTDDVTGLVDITTAGGALLMGGNAVSGNGVNLTATGAAITVDGAVNAGAGVAALTAGTNVTTSAAVSGASVNVQFGQSAAGVFTANGGTTFTGATTVTGGGSGNNFNVNTPIAANLIGGAGSDTFTLASALTGSVNGGAAATDTLQGAALSNATLTVAGPAHGFSGTISGVSAGFQNIDTLNATGTLTGANTTATWTGSVSNAGSYTDGSNTLTFSGFGNLTGGTGNDTFNVVNITGNLVGGDGTNTYSSAIVGGNLTGGTGTDILSSVSVTGSIDAGAGAATLTGPVSAGGTLTSGTGGGTTTTSGAVTTGGGQTYSGPVTLGGSTTMQSTGGGTIDFNSTVTGTGSGTENLTIATTGAVELGTGIGGGGTPLAGMTVAGALPPFGDLNNIPPVGSLAMANITATTSTTGSVVLSSNTFSGTGTITTGSLTINGEISPAPDFSITLAVLNLTVTGPNGSLWRFGGDVGNNSAAVPPGSGIGVFTTVDGFLTLTATQAQGAQTASLAAANAAAQASGDASNVFGTDSVAQQVEYGFAGDVGTLPPIDHRLQGVGISVPDCFNESREGEGCAGQ